MGVLIGIFLLIFWVGVIMLVLSFLGILLVSPWAILIFWLVLMGLYTTGFLFYLKYSEKYANY